MGDKIYKLVSSRLTQICKMSEEESSNVQFAAVGKAMAYGGIPCLELETDDIMYVIEALIDFAAYSMKENLIKEALKKQAEKEQSEST